MLSLLAIGFMVAAVVAGWRRKMRVAVTLGTVAIVLAWAGILTGS